MRFLFVVLLALPLQAFAQYPQHPIKLIVPFPPAGSTDVVGRIVALKLGERLGQPVIVENRPGGGGSIGSDFVAKSPADGYTLLMATSSTHSIGPALQKLPYDPIKDFAAVTHIANAPNVLVVSPKLPVASVKELVAYAKARPGALNYASSGIGTITHLNAELFKMLTGVDAVHVPYKGTALSVPDIANGNVAFLFDNLASVMPHVKSGNVKPLAIDGQRRSALLPDVPTLAEAGLPAFDLNAWFGLFAPAGTPGELVQRLQVEVAAALKAHDLRERFDIVGFEVVGGSSADFVKRIRSDAVRWAEVIRAGNVKVQ